MCEKCKEVPFVKFIGVHADVLKNAIHSFINDHGRLPTDAELTQKILSDKCRANTSPEPASNPLEELSRIVNASINKPDKPVPPAKNDGIYLSIMESMLNLMPRELIMALPKDARSIITHIKIGFVPSLYEWEYLITCLRSAGEKTKDNEKMEDPSGPKETGEISFEQCIEDATIKVKAMFDDLERKYGDEILFEVIDNIINDLEEKLSSDDDDEDYDLDLEEKIDHIDSKLSLMENQIQGIYELLATAHQQQGVMLTAEAISAPVESNNQFIMSIMLDVKEAREQIKDMIKHSLLKEPEITMLKKVSKKLKKTLNKGYLVDFLSTASDEE